MKILILFFFNFISGGQIQTGPENMYFKHNVSVIAPAQEQVLNGLASELIKSGKRCTIMGHAAHSEGTAQFAMNLSKLRAEKVLAYLRLKRVPKAQLKIQSFGYSKPIGSNATEEGRSQNRRVEFLVR